MILLRMQDIAFQSSNLNLLFHSNFFIPLFMRTDHYCVHLVRSLLVWPELESLKNPTLSKSLSTRDWFRRDTRSSTLSPLLGALYYKNWTDFFFVCALRRRWFVLYYTYMTFYLVVLI